jgi:hemolysin III
MLRLERGLAEVVLVGVWGTVLLGGLLKTVWYDPPKWASATIYVSVASVSVLFLPQVVAAIGIPATALMLLGGAFYVAGAIVFGLQRPDPVPEVFGYHEVFHALVIGGALTHFVAIALYIVPGTPTA